MEVAWWLYFTTTILVFCLSVGVFVAAWGGKIEAKGAAKEEYRFAAKMLAIIAASSLLLIWPVALVGIMLYLAFRRKGLDEQQGAR